MNLDRNKNTEGLDYFFNKTACQVLKEHRIKKGMTMQELGNKLEPKLTRQAIYGLENNRTNLKLESFKKICMALDLEPADVFNEISLKTINKINNNDSLK